MIPLIGRILGLRTVTLTRRDTGFQPVTASVAGGQSSPGRPSVSGVARVSWRISSVLTPGAAHGAGAVPPRVRIGWTAQDEAANGNLLNPGNASDPKEANAPPFLLADAWYGQIELIGTSYSVETGYLPEDGTPDADYVVQATICQGGTGATQFATFSRLVVLGAPGGLDVYVPGATAIVNNGAARCPTFQWISTSNVVVTIRADDFAGSATQILTTGAVLAPGFSSTPAFVLPPDTLRLNVSAAAPVTGRLLFNYF